jgi:hypothetical protein
MTQRWGVLAALLLAAVFIAAGCPRCPGELVSREELFDRYNTNADGLRTLWAVADIEIQLNHRGLFQSIRIPDGRLYFRRRGDDPLAPQNFMLRGKELDQEFFRLGIDGGQGLFYYWADVPGRAQFARWGTVADADSGALGSAVLNPANMLSLLGVLPWPTDLDAPSQVALETLDKPCVYQMLVFSRRDAWDGWYLARKIWLDRRADPPRPYKVWLFDRQGQVAMEADLGDYEAVFMGGKVHGGPVIPTDIRIRWPDSDPVRAIRLRLSGASVETDEQTVPSEAGFEMHIPGHIGDVRSLGGPVEDPVR